ncbi:MAG: ribonuclease HII [Neomegalonema sp.]|nr:ribonuclease HII [Neomegalonema sp.]
MVFEREMRAHLGARARVCGIDEVGRGPLAGPVLACAVILGEGVQIAGLTDSKALSARRRTDLAQALWAAQARGAVEIGVGAASVREIEQINILRANDLAMARAVAALGAAPDCALIDGNRVPPTLEITAKALVKGDARSASIAAASIIAKELRDRLMRQLDHRYPGYGWARNAGYPTRAHKAAIAELGLTPHHRRSFRGCQLSPGTGPASITAPARALA